MLSSQVEMSQKNLTSTSSSIMPKSKDSDELQLKYRERGESGTSVSSDTARTGTCKWFNVLKGWGFLTPDDGGSDVFVHQSVLHMPGFRSLDQGESVEFFDKQTDRGYEATVVTGPGGLNCKGSSVRPLGKKKFRRIRCFNCGQYGNHVAAKCRLGSLPKCCYHCHETDHLIAECPLRQQSNTQSHANRSDSDQPDPDNHDSSTSSSVENAKEPSKNLDNHHAVSSPSEHTTGSETEGTPSRNVEQSESKGITDSADRESPS